MFDTKKKFTKKNAPHEPSAVTALRKEFADCSDLEERLVETAHLRAWVFWLDGCTASDAVSEDVIRPLLRLKGSDASERALRGGVWRCSAQARQTVREAAGDLLSGSAAVLFGRSAVILTFEVKSGARRGVEAPTVEKSVLGAKDAFTETLSVNTALVRRRLQTNALKLETLSVGQLSATKVSVLRIEGKVSPAQLRAVRERLSSIGTDGLLTAGDLELCLTDEPRSAFPQLLHTERPDRFALGLLRGQIGLLSDGLPVGFLLPGTLPEMLRVAEDRARHTAVASFLLLLRWAALFLSLLLPALYVAVAMYHQEMIPYKLMQSVIASKQEVPFSTAAEILGMLFSFELLQEAGIRLPESVGQTVSIIGALIVGQSAVEAKVLSPIVIIVVAIAGIAGYTQPSQELGAAIRIWRFLLVLCALLLGMFGVAAGSMVLLWRLCNQETLGVAFLYPLCDAPLREGLRALLRLPGRRREKP